MKINTVMSLELNRALKVIREVIISAGCPDSFGTILMFVWISLIQIVEKG